MAAAELMELLATLPESALIPVGWLREKLGENAPASRPDPEGLSDSLFTVPDLAKRYGLSTSAVRAFFTAGRFPGAFRLRGRKWVAPLSAVRAFEAAEREAPENPVAPESLRVGHSIGDWRRQKARAGGVQG